MPRIVFLGRVLPSGTQIGIHNAPTIRLPIRNLSYTVDITTEADNSSVRVTCDLPIAFKLEHLINIYIDVVILVSGMVNLAAFTLGAGVVLCLDRWIDPDGNELEISINDPNLPQYCTSFSGDTFQKVLNLLVAEPYMHMGLTDLILGQYFPNHALINCARAVEGIRHMIVGHGTDPKKAWPIMCDLLNIDRSYIQPITENSTKPRHGNVVIVDGVTVQLVSQRSWVIMDRFLHYRLGGNQKLPLVQFPLLQG